MTPFFVEANKVFVLIFNQEKDFLGNLKKLVKVEGGILEPELSEMLFKVVEGDCATYGEFFSHP